MMVAQPGNYILPGGGGAGEVRLPGGEEATTRRDIKHDLSPEIASKSLSALKAKSHTDDKGLSTGGREPTARNKDQGQGSGVELPVLLFFFQS